MWVQLYCVCNNNQARSYNAEMLCEEMGFKFSKFRKRKQYNFSVKHFPIWCYNCNTMIFVDKKKRIILFSYHKNCITAFLVIRYNCLSAQQQRAFKLTPATRALCHFKMLCDKG
jgi:hypothetical protein